MKKKIAWITPEGYIDTDFYVVPLLCEAFEIDWFIIYKDKIPYETELESFRDLRGLSIKPYRQTTRFRSLKTAMSDINLFLQIRHARYDIIYAGMFGFPYFHLFSSLMLCRKKMVIAAHNVNTPKGAVNYHAAKAYASYVLSIFKNFQTFSRSQHDLLLKMYPGKNVLMAPFLLKDYGQPSIEKSDCITFLSFGNIRDYKRIDVLIKAAQDTYERTGKLFRVIIAGNCNNWAKYQTLIKYPQLFDLRIKRVENEDIPNLFGESHYFVAPYQDIAQSGSVIVAINYDCPIIASNLEAFREYVVDGKTGYLIKPADEEDLARVMTKIVSEKKSDYNRMVDEIKGMKQCDFNTQAILNKYIQFFESL